jgi:hypothetical protein
LQVLKILRSSWHHPFQVVEREVSINKSNHIPKNNLKTVVLKEKYHHNRREWVKYMTRSIEKINVTMKDCYQGQNKELLNEKQVFSGCE